MKPQNTLKNFPKFNLEDIWNKKNMAFSDEKIQPRKPSRFKINILPKPSKRLNRPQFRQRTKNPLLKRCLTMGLKFNRSEGGTRTLDFSIMSAAL